MRKWSLSGGLLVALMLVASGTVSAQTTPDAGGDETETVVRVELRDGSVIVGTVLRETETEITLRTVGGVEATVPREQILRMRSFEGRVADGRLVVYDPNRTRLLFSPTARPIGRGHGYLSTYQIVVPFVAYGITDEISIAGGTVLLPEAFGRVLYVAPKVTLYQQEQVAVALGGIGLGIFVDDNPTTAGIGFGLLTYGTPERAITAGLGFAFADGELATGAIVTLGGELQVSNSIKLLTENYLIPFERPDFHPQGSTTRTVYEPVFSAGVRFFGQRLAADLAGLTFPELLREGHLFPFIPWVGFAYNFGG